MNMPTRFENPSNHKWMTLNVMDVGDKFILEEPARRHRARRIVESAFIVLVSALLIGSYLIFILPGLSLGATSFGVSLSVMCIASALVLYAFATRGHANQVGFDRRNKKIWLCKLNARGHARIVTHFAKRDVNSLYIRRPDEGSKEAALMARLSGKAVPATILRGTLKDIQAAHDALSLELREASVKPAHVRRAVKARRKPVAHAATGNVTDTGAVTV